MIQRTLLGMIVVLFFTTAIASAQVQAETKQGATQPSPQSRNEIKDLRTDLDNMHNLLALMQRNVAFVSAGDTPLKHQFELEIEMWQLLIRDMEKKTGTSDASPSLPCR